MKSRSKGRGDLEELQGRGLSSDHCLMLIPGIEKLSNIDSFRYVF